MHIRAEWFGLAGIPWSVIGLVTLGVAGPDWAAIPIGLALVCWLAWLCLVAWHDTR